MAYYYSPFRKDYDKKKADGACNFCDDEMMTNQGFRYKDGVLVENETYRWVVNIFPKFEGHTLIVPKRHLVDMKEESEEEIKDRNKLIILASEALKKLYPGAGIEIFMQIGEGSEASIKHLHWHVVPALPSDKLRSFEKLGHFYTTEKDKEKIVIFPIEIEKVGKMLQEGVSEVLGN